jgi:hypothetical protein
MAALPFLPTCPSEILSIDDRCLSSSPPVIAPRVSEILQIGNLLLLFSFSPFLLFSLSPLSTYPHLLSSLLSLTSILCSSLRMDVTGKIAKKILSNTDIVFMVYAIKRWNKIPAEYNKVLHNYKFQLKISHRKHI